MFKSKFEDNEVDISMKKETIEQLTQNGINYIEVFRLIESFAQKLLVTREDTELRMENEDTQATIDIAITWDHEAKKVQIDVQGVNLNKMTPKEMPSMPKGSKVNLAQSGAEPNQQPAVDPSTLN